MIQQSRWKLFGLLLAVFHSSDCLLALQLETQWSQSSMRPIGTEQLVEIDPLLANPQRQAFVIQHELSIKATNEILSHSTLYLRDDPSWFAPESSIPCESKALQKVLSNHSLTLDAAKHLAQWQFKLWKQILQRALPQLELKLNKTLPLDSALQLESKQDTLLTWLRPLKRDWRIKSQDLKEAKLYYSKHCSSIRQPSSVHKVPNWESKMQEDEKNIASEPHLLAVVPYKLLDSGNPSLRLQVRWGFRVLNGRFILDPNRLHSWISPAFMRFQGVEPESKLVRLERAWDPGLKRQIDRVFPHSLDIAGFTRPSISFILEEASYEGTDGILGLDFLQQYPLEFQKFPAQNVRIFERKAFSPMAKQGRQLEWKELSQSKMSSKTVQLNLQSTQRSPASAASAAPFLNWKNMVDKSHFILDLPHGKLWIDSEKALK